MENVSVLKKREKKEGHFLTPKVSVFMEIGVFFRDFVKRGPFSNQGTLICPPFLGKCGYRGLHSHGSRNLCEGGPRGAHKLSVGRGWELGAG